MNKKKKLPTTRIILLRNTKPIKKRHANVSYNELKKYLLLNQIYTNHNK